MTLTPAQKQIAKDIHRFRVLNCGRRFGKTTLASEEIKGIALAKEARIAYIAPTIQQARDIMWGMLKKELLPITIKSKEAPSLELEVKNKEGKSSFIFLRGWEAIETLRGQAFDFIVIDEVASMRNFWVGYDEVLSPTLIDRRGSVMFISTPKGFNHFYDLFNKQDSDDTYKSFHFTSYDNPFLPFDEIEREKKSKPDNAFAQEYLADFRKQEGLVYKEFNRDSHLCDDFTQRGQIVERILGIDFGFTNPCAILTIERDYDNNLWVTDEWYKTGKTEDEIATYAISCNAHVAYPDPANPSAIKVLQDRGLNVREVDKSAGSVTTGINKVRELFKANKIKINKRCINLISELETYRYDDTVKERMAENPIKEHDHALDALSYVVRSIPENITIQQDDFGLYRSSFK